MSVRLVLALGVEAIRDYLEKFGFDRARLPQGLSLALGSATVTPMEIARAYGVFANGGYLVEPFFIARVEDPSGRIVEYANRQMLCSGCGIPISESSDSSQPSPDLRFSQQVVSPQNAFILDSMMREVIRSGTGRAAGSLQRDDLAGKPERPTTILMRGSRDTVPISWPPFGWALINRKTLARVSQEPGRLCPSGSTS